MLYSSSHRKAKAIDRNNPIQLNLGVVAMIRQAAHVVQSHTSIVCFTSKSRKAWLTNSLENIGSVAWDDKRRGDGGLTSWSLSNPLNPSCGISLPNGLKRPGNH
jgi:hypothetical protein